MSPVTHALLSWILANAPGTTRRERIAITLAGVAPDIDGFGYPIELLTHNSAQPLEWFHQFHHHLTHNLISCLFIAGIAWWFGGRSRRVAILALIAALGHLGCDLIGARGPDGYSWPIPFWQPLSDISWSWSGQWGLQSWENGMITLFALVLTWSLAVKRGFSPVNMVSPTTDEQVVMTLRRFAPIALLPPLKHS